MHTIKFEIKNPYLNRFLTDNNTKPKLTVNNIQHYIFYYKLELKYIIDATGL